MTFNLILFWTLPVVALALVLLAVFWYRRNPFLSALDLQLLSIRLPQKEESAGKEFLTEINLAEQLYGALSSIRRPIVLEVAVHHLGQDINFYLAVPRPHVDFAKRQIQGLFLEAEVTTVSDYTIFQPGGETVAAHLTLAESNFIPLRTYREAEADTFAPIVSTLSRLRQEGDGAVIQYIFKPAEEKIGRGIASSIEQLKKGVKLKNLLDQSLLHLSDLKEVFASPTKSPSTEAKVVDEEAVRALTQKAAKPLYAVNIRLVASSDLAGRAEEILLSLAGAFSQFTAPWRNKFKVVKVKNPRRLSFEYIFREFNPRQAIILNSEELASVYHLPSASAAVPHIAWLKNREIEPPRTLSPAGVVIGRSLFRGEEKLIRLAPADRLRHLYVVGQTGVGKSYGLLLPMALQDIAAGDGVCVIDPHGELVDDILERIPPERAGDVVVFDPGDRRRPLGLNMLECDPTRPEERSFVADELIKIFNNLYDLKVTGGPMFEYYLRNALLLAIEDAPNEPSTLLDLPRLFSDSEYRQRKLSRIRDPLVIDFWTKEAAKATGEQGLANMTVYIVSKFSSFISNDYLRPIIGQIRSSFNVRTLMDQRKILLVKLSKGRIGDLNANLLGMIITGRILMAALARGDVGREERVPFYFYIDEFQNFTTDSIAVILSEARKYGLGLTVAHQFIGQLKDSIREAVFGNVGSLVAFRVGAEDTETLLKQLGPEFKAQDLVTMENQRMAAKILVNGEPSRPFSLACQHVSSAPHSSLKEKLQELSRLTYGRDLAAVEEEIVARLR